jgi:hypothetical protein
MFSKRTYRGNRQHKEHLQIRHISHRNASKGKPSEELGLLENVRMSAQILIVACIDTDQRLEAQKQRNYEPDYDNGRVVHNLKATNIVTRRDGVEKIPQRVDAICLSRSANL